MTIDQAADVDDQAADVDEPDPLAVWSPLGWPATSWPEVLAWWYDHSRARAG